MAISERPVNIKVYYRLFRENKKELADNSRKRLDELEKEVESIHKNILTWVDVYNNQFDFDPNKYDEFRDNKYSTGKFLRVTKGLLVNKQNDYELVGDLFTLYDLATKQKEIYDLNNTIRICNKCITLSLKDYIEVLRVYYTEVHKKLVLDGYGYAFSNNIGCICVARCLVNQKRRRKKLDFAATKKREKELLAAGKKIYNKEEADWCLRNGIEYKAEDKRVFLSNEYYYQIPLFYNRIKGVHPIKFTIADYRHVKYRGMTNDDLIELCGGDTKKICDLQIDLKTKVTLCDKVDKLLYTKFIRNENQKPFIYSQNYRKDR